MVISTPGKPTTVRAVDRDAPSSGSGAVSLAVQRAQHVESGGADGGRRPERRAADDR